MASYSVAKAAHKTLSGTTVDIVTLTGELNAVEIANRVGAATLYVSTDGSTPTSGGDDFEFVAAGEAIMLSPSTKVVKLIGSGNEYSVTAVDE